MNLTPNNSGYKLTDDLKFSISKENFDRVYQPEIDKALKADNIKKQSSVGTIIASARELFSKTGAINAPQNSSYSNESLRKNGFISYTKATQNMDTIKKQLLDFCDQNHINTESGMNYIFKTALPQLENKIPPYDAPVPAPTANSATIPLTSLVGSTAASLYNNDATKLNFATEAFGLTVNNVQHDNVAALQLQTFQLKNSVLDRVMRRDPESSITITFTQAVPEVYNLDRSRSLNTNERTMNHVPLIDTKAERADFLDTTPHLVEVLPENDPDGKLLWKGKVNNLAVPFNDNIMTLSLNKNSINAGIDFTDLLSEGGTIDSIIVEISDGSNTSYVRVLTKPLTSAMFAADPNTPDSGTQNANFTHVFVLNSNTLDCETNAPATALAAFTDATVYAEITYAGSINLKLGDLNANSNINPNRCTVRNKLHQVITDESDPSFKLMKKLTFKPVAMIHTFQWSEENLRKTTTAVRVNENQRQVNIPVGKSYIVDLSMAQSPEELTLKLTGDAISIGNDIRGLTVINDRLEMTAEMVSSTDAILALQNKIISSNISIAWAQSRPYVIKDTLDLSDNKNYANLKQSELLADIHSRITQSLLKNLAILGGKTLYTDNLEPGEVLTYKLIGYGPLVDLTMGIDQYHATLDDVTRVDNDSSADLIVTLQNGIRLEIVKTYFTKFMNKFMIIPFRKNEDPNGILSFGSIKDAGMYAVDFMNNSSSGSTSRRFISNSRSFPVVTNAMGMILELPNWQQLFSKYNILNQIDDTLQQIAGGNGGSTNNPSNGSGSGTGTGTGGSGSDTSNSGSQGSGGSSSSNTSGTQSGGKNSTAKS